MTIIQPVNRFPVPYRQHLEEIIHDIHACGHEITHFIGDNPKRAIVREALNHASHYACEYCSAKAGRTATIPKGEKDVQCVTDAITYLQNMTGSSKMADKTDIHLNSLMELKKNCQFQKEEHN